MALMTAPRSLSEVVQDIVRELVISLLFLLSRRIHGRYIPLACYITDQVSSSRILIFSLRRC